jgi:hypothetical protein
VYKTIHKISPGVKLALLLKNDRLANQMSLQYDSNNIKTGINQYYESNVSTPKAKASAHPWLFKAESDWLWPPCH